MKKCLLLCAVALLVASIPASAGRVTYSDVTHELMFVQQAYAGDSNGTNVSFAGNCQGCEVITAVPGVLSIVPGDFDANEDGVIDPLTERWSCFISSELYSIKSVRLTKDEGEPAQCNWYFDGGHILQRGTEAIRLWWPLMYEAPNTTWTLEIFYTVPGEPVIYNEVWSWKVGAADVGTWLASMDSLIDLFHQLPFGLCEVPLIQSETLYGELKLDIDAIEAAMATSEPDYEAALDALVEFEFDVLEACVGAGCPLSPMPDAGGIVNTEENPACCKLLVDAEYLGVEFGIFLNAK